MEVYNSTVEIVTETNENDVEEYVLYATTTFSEPETYIASPNVNLPVGADENGAYNIECFVETIQTPNSPNVVQHIVNLSSLDLEVDDVVNVSIFHGTTLMSKGSGVIKQTGSNEDVKPGDIPPTVDLENLAD